MTIEASTLLFNEGSCNIPCQIESGYGCILHFGPSAAAIELKDTAISTNFPDGGYPGLLLESVQSQPPAFNANTTTWIQPIDGQDASALEAITNQPALMTAGVGFIQPFAGFDSRVWATPVADGVLIDAIPQAACADINQLINPIDLTCITEDVLGNPRVDGNDRRNIGAVQTSFAPHLALHGVSDGRVGLIWSRPHDPDSGAITGYEVCHGTGTPPDSVGIGTACPGSLLPFAGAQTLTGEVTGLSNGTASWFLVRGVNPAPGPWSNRVSATPYGPVGTPVVNAIPGGNQVELKWTKPDDGGRGLSGYVVYYRVAGITDWILSQLISGGDILHATVSSLVGGTAYEFGVQAVATDGTSGGIGTVEVTPLIVPATFHVTKAYSDANETPVEVTLSCNSGLPLEQSFTIAPGNPVAFVLSDFAPGTVRCEVTESGSPEGYVPQFDNGNIVSATSCLFDTVLSGGNHTCAIMNRADTARFTILKNWVLTGGAFEGASYDVQVDVVCSRKILSVDGQPVIDPDGTITVFLGDGESSVLEVDTLTGSSRCTAMEMTTQSGVESSAEGCTNVPLTAGETAQCTFTNTVFFEGIPALSRFGLALLALLMLGMGLIGSRRLA